MTTELTFDNIYKNKLRNVINVDRFSGRRLIFPESIPDHIADMVAIGIDLSNYINNKSDVSNKIDIKELVYRINIHDFDESFLCDIPRALKYYNTTIRDVIEDIVQDILRNQLPQNLIDDINNSKSGSFEGYLVKCLDIIQCGFTLYREVIELNNKTLEDLLLGNLALIKSLIDYTDLEVKSLPREKVYLIEYIKVIYEHLNSKLEK